MFIHATQATAISVSRSISEYLPGITIHSIVLDIETEQGTVNITITGDEALQITGNIDPLFEDES